MAGKPKPMSQIKQLSRTLGLTKYEIPVGYSGAVMADVQPLYLVSSQLPVASWYEIFVEETIADAILDRLIHTSYRIELKSSTSWKKYQ